jgi:hypothetical protein
MEHARTHIFHLANIFAVQELVIAPKDGQEACAIVRQLVQKIAQEMEFVNVEHVSVTPVGPDRVIALARHQMELA